MEDMASPESKKLVDSHISECESCKKELDSLSALRLPIQTETSSLQHIKKTIFRQRLFTAFTAVVVVLTLLTGIYTFLNADIYIPGEKMIDNITVSDGNLNIGFHYTAMGSNIGWYEGRNSAVMVLSTRMWDYLFRKNDASAPKRRGTILNADSEFIQGNVYTLYLGELPTDCSIWYADIRTGKAAIPLWNAEAADRSDALSLYVSNSLFYWFSGILTAAIVLAAASRFAKGPLRSVLQITAALCISICAGLFLYHGGQFVSFGNPTPLALSASRNSLLSGLPLFLSILCIRKLLQWRKAN